jgi:hypothetical protein
MLRPGNTASSTIENSAHWRRHHRKPLQQKVTLRIAIRCPMVRSLAVLPQEKRLRVLALFSLAHGPRKVPNTPSRVGLLTPNQCFSLTKWWRRWYCLIQRQTMKNDDRAKGDPGISVETTDGRSSRLQRIILRCIHGTVSSPAFQGRMHTQLVPTLRRHRYGRYPGPLGPTIFVKSYHCKHYNFRDW